MNLKSTRYWIAAAAVLFVLVVINGRFGPGNTAHAPVRVLDALKPAEVTTIQVLPKGQSGIRAERVKDRWQLVEPLAYLAEAGKIERLLTYLEQLSPAVYITAQERKHRPRADEEDGFIPPVSTVVIQQGKNQRRIHIGSKTAPGDQVFVQVVGLDGVYVVDAGLLDLVPSSVNEWRDPNLIDPGGASPDRVAITNGPKAFELVRDANTRLWRILPIQARADSAKIEDLLQKLGGVRASHFVTDNPSVDLESLGLQPPALQIALGQGGNSLALLQFGKSPTNEAAQVYARRLGQNAVVTVPRESLAPWFASSVDFRDPYLVTLTGRVGVIEVADGESFSIAQGTNGGWRILPRDWPADAGFVKDFLAALSGLRIVEFTKDIVTEPDLPNYGLAQPRRKYTLRSAGAAVEPAGLPLAELHFGTNHDESIYVRRTDETSVYAVRLADFQRLPATDIEFRERQIWDAAENEIAGVTILQGGRKRRMVRNGPHEWSLAPGSQGIINPIAVEETARMLGRLAAAGWIGRGEEIRKGHGFSENSHQVTIELRSGGKLTVEFGPELPSKPQYAAVTM